MKSRLLALRYRVNEDRMSGSNLVAVKLAAG
jgi:hypothetical protein